MTAGVDYYRVSYEIDIEGANKGKYPRKSAKEAFEYMRDPGSMKPVLDVFDHDGTVTRIDLEEDE